MDLVAPPQFERNESTIGDDPNADHNGQKTDVD